MYSDIGFHFKTFQLSHKKMLSWIQLLGVFSLALVGAMADTASLATANDEFNFISRMQRTQKIILLKSVWMRVPASILPFHARPF